MNGVHDDAGGYDGAWLDGGLTQGGGATSMANLTLAADLPFGIHGGTTNAFVQVLGIFGEGFGSLVGDLQGVSNIDAPSAWRLYQMWVEHRTSSGRFAALVGLYDLNSDFYATGTSGPFLNSSHGIGPEFALTGRAGPSIFPATSLAVRLMWTPVPAVAWKVAVFDAVPGARGRPQSFGFSFSRKEGALIVSELEGVVGDFAVGGPGLRLAGGAWVYSSSEAALLDPDEHVRNHGGYAMVEGAFPGCSASGHCMRAFLRRGTSASQVNAVAAAWDAGLVLEDGATGSMVGVAMARE